MASTNKTLFLTRFSILLALEAIFCFTPLGSLRLTPGIVATLMLVPVIVTAILLGPKAGSLMGGIAGLFSCLVWTFMPPGVEAFVFSPFYSLGDLHGNGWSLVICFVPRILVGTVAGLVFQAMDKRLSTGRKKWFAYGLSGLLGSLTNTIGVLGGIYIFFGPQYAAVYEMPYAALLGAIGMVIAVNGVLEAIVATLAAALICQPLRLMARKTA